MIPRIFHFIFGLKPQVEPFHLVYYLCLASCLEINRPEAVYFHYKHKPFGKWWERIQPRLTLCPIEPDAFIQKYDYKNSLSGKYRYAHLADFARLEILYEHGGIYADMDTLFLRPVPDRWFQHEFIMGKERSPADDPCQGSLCNAWIGSAPEAEFCQIWKQRMKDSFDGTWSNHSTLLPFRLSQQYPKLLHVEPEQSFFRLDWTPEGIHDLFLRVQPDLQDSYSLHLWNHLWWDSERLDFSFFHSGRLTEDYVAFANSTYAIHSRRFLPADIKVNRIGYLIQTLSEWSRYPRYFLRRHAGSLDPNFRISS